MPFDPSRYHRVCVDLTDKEYVRLHERTRSIGATKAGYIRRLIERATKDIRLNDTPPKDTGAHG
jgi:predicted DNA-binding protein